MKVIKFYFLFILYNNIHDFACIQQMTAWYLYYATKLKNSDCTCTQSWGSTRGHFERNIDFFCD